MQITIGLVGCGSWGQNILRDLLSLGCSVCVADPDPKAQENALKMGARTVVERSDDLEDKLCTAYVVASPIKVLAQEAEKMLLRDKVVFCEKPVFIFPKEEEKLLEAGAEKRLHAMYKFWYHQGINALKDIIDNNELGSLELIRLSRTSWDNSFHGTDCLWYAVVHQLSIIYYLLGYIPEPKVVNLIYHRNVITGVLIKIEGEAKVMIDVSSREPIKSFIVSLHCLNGVAVMPDAYAKALLIKREGCEIEKRNFKNEMPLFKELKDFVEYLQGGPAPKCGMKEAREITKAVWKIRNIAGLNGYL